MIYNFPVTVPANTAKIDATEKVVKLGAGVVHKLEVAFTPGPQGLTHVQIFDNGHQLWPSNLGGDFATDNETISYSVFHRITSGFTKLRIVTWNTDTLHDHTVVVRLGVLPLFIVFPYMILRELVDTFKTIVGIE